MITPNTIEECKEKRKQISDLLERVKAIEQVPTGYPGYVEEVYLYKRYLWRMVDKLNTRIGELTP